MNSPEGRFLRDARLRMALEDARAAAIRIRVQHPRHDTGIRICELCCGISLLEEAVGWVMPVEDFRRQISIEGHDGHCLGACNVCQVIDLAVKAHEADPLAVPHSGFTVVDDRLRRAERALDDIDTVVTQIHAGYWEHQ